MNKIFIATLVTFLMVISAPDSHAQLNKLRFGDNKGEKILNSSQKSYIEAQKQTELLENLIIKQDEIVSQLKSEIEVLKKNHQESQKLMMALIKQLAKQSKSKDTIEK